MCVFIYLYTSIYNKDLWTDFLKKLTQFYVKEKLYKLMIELFIFDLERL